MIPVKRWCDVPTPSTLPILHTHTRALTEMARLPEFSVQVMGMCVGLAWHAGGECMRVRYMHDCVFLHLYGKC